MTKQTGQKGASVTEMTFLLIFFLFCFQMSPALDRRLSLKLPSWWVHTINNLDFFFWFIFGYYSCFIYFSFTIEGQKVNCWRQLWMFVVCKWENSTSRMFQWETIVREKTAFYLLVIIDTTVFVVSGMGATSSSPACWTWAGADSKPSFMDLLWCMQRALVQCVTWCHLFSSGFGGRFMQRAWTLNKGFIFFVFSSHQVMEELKQFSEQKNNWLGTFTSRSTVLILFNVYKMIVIWTFQLHKDSNNSVHIFFLWWSKNLQEYPIIVHKTLY